jgi:hypothetical protein
MNMFRFKLKILLNNVILYPLTENFTLKNNIIHLEYFDVTLVFDFILSFIFKFNSKVNTKNTKFTRIYFTYNEKENLLVSK